MRKIFTLLCVALCATSLFANVVTGTCGDNLQWAYDTDTKALTITGSGYMYWSGERPWSQVAGEITSVSLPDGLTSIGNDAFSGCSSLSSVTIPNSVTSIGWGAFCYCSSLTSITIPNSVTSIGWYAFDGCTSLTSLTIPNSVTSIGYAAFSSCSSLTSVTIPNSVTSIGDEAFYKCSSLTSVAIPDGVTSIGNSAFYDCSSLTSITIPNSVKSIGSFAFYDCSSLTSVTIGNSVESIGYAAFSSCSSLTSVTIPNSVTSIGSSAFEGCNSLASVTIPNGVRYIEHGTFYECSKLKSIIIPEGVEGIGYEAFYNCSSLTSITIPNSVMVIETGAFARCSSLNSLTIGNSVKYIGEIVFRECSALTSIVWNAEMCTDFDFEYDIDYKTYNAPFYEIRSQITSFVFGDSVQHIPAYLCYGMDNLSSITIPNSVTSIGEGAFSNCSALESIVWKAKNYTNPTNKEAAPFYDICSQIKSFTFGENVEHIPAYLCYGMDKLTSVTTPNSLKTIGTSAFEGCIRLGKVSLGYGMENIAANAFSECKRLYDIYCYASYPPFADESSFANYNVYLYVPCENQRDYILDVVWGNFKFIECIGAESENMGGDSVVINTGSTDVTITWPTDDDADNYIIVIEKDGEVVCTLTFNSEGQLLNIAFAPSREGNHPAQYAEAITNGYRFTVTGLEEGTDYTYTVTSKDAANKTISEHSGEFTTNSATALDNTHSQSTNCQKILRDGHLLIIRDGKTYNARGVEL